MEQKKDYSKPQLIRWGTVADLTQTGNTRPSNDIFGGSVGGPTHPLGQYKK